MPKTVTLAGVRTKNGMRVSEIIAMLSLTSIENGNTVYKLGIDDCAVDMRIDTEILILSTSGLSQGMRDQVYLMPQECAERRCKEQPKNLKLVPEATYSVFGPGNPVFDRILASTPGIDAPI